jgi:Ca2+-transporting ATPase
VIVNGGPRQRRRPVVVPLSTAVPGRLRVRVSSLRDDPALASRLEATLTGRQSIRAARASALTGGVLVFFDPERLATRDIVREIARVMTDGLDAPAPTSRGGRDDDAWHTVPIETIAVKLGTRPEQGLATEDAEGRLAQIGPNRLPMPQPRSALGIVMDHLGSLPSVMLIGAAALSVASGAVLEALVIGAVVAGNTVIGYLTESRIERILTSLQGTGEVQVLVRRDGQDEQMSAAALVPGDVLVLRAGHPVGADARLVVAEGLAVDEASLTGESVPAAKKATVLDDRSLAVPDRGNMVFAGTAVVEGSGLAIVVATAERTQIGHVRRLVAEAVTPGSPLERQLDRTGRDLVFVCLALSGLTLALGLLRGIPLLEMTRTALSLAVAAVPEGLPAVATTTLALGMQRMMRRGMLVRRLPAVESLGSVTVICADKTGTLTENRMTVDTWFVGGRRFRGAEAVAAATTTPALRLALSTAVLCNEAELEPGSMAVRGSSTEGALLGAALAAGVDYRSERMRFPLLFLRPRANGDNWMATIHAERGGRLVAVKGAPEEVLARADRHLTPAGEERRLTPASRVRILRTNHGLAARGLRVLGLAVRYAETDETEPCDRLVWIGLVGLADPVRPGVAAALAACRRAGIRTMIITGDQAETAVAVARELGVTSNGTARVIDAARLAGLDDSALREAVRDIEVVARVTPAHKYHIVRALQAGGEIVAMTGDGINDAAALRAADVGIAMGARGTDVARDVADVVLVDDDFGAIVAAIEQGRGIRANVSKALRFLLATNLSELLVAASALAVGVTRPMTAIQFLWINLLSDVAPALALAVEPPEPDVMLAPPHDPAEPMLGAEMLRAVAGDGTVLAATALTAHALAGGWRGAGMDAGSVAFSTLTMSQLVHALKYRTPGTPSRRLPAVVAVSVGVQAAAMLVPPLRRMLGLMPLGLAGWGVVAGAAAMPAVLRSMQARTDSRARPLELRKGGS